MMREEEGGSQGNSYSKKMFFKTSAQQLHLAFQHLSS